MSAFPLVGSFLKAFGWVKSVFLWLRSFVPGVQLVLGLIALFVAVFSGIMWYRSQDTMVQTFLGALTYKSAPTSQDYKALEAIILSSLDDGRGRADGGELSDELDVAFYNVMKKLAGEPPPAQPPRRPPPRRLRGLRDCLSDIKLTTNRQTDDRRIWHQYVTLDATQSPGASRRFGLAGPDDFNKVFLYVPGISLSTGGSGDAPVEPENLNEVVRRDARLCRDIEGALGLARFMPEFETVKNIFKNSPATVVQSYFITRSGVALLRLSGVSNQRKHYEQVFPDESGYTFLPGRPYFWPAVSNRYKGLKYERSQRENRKFNHLSAPYIDLGINGPVRTYCWGFVGGDTAATTDAVLCLDVALADTRDRIENMLRKNLTGEVSFPECFTNKHCTDDQLGLFLQQEREKGTQDLLGAIHVFEDVGDNKPLVFTVPLGVKEDGQGNLTYKLVKATVDLNQMRYQRLVIGSVALAGMVFFLTILITLLLVYLERKHESVKLLNNLDGVMAHISEPYVRVDPDDKIKKANAAFRKMIENEEIEGKDIRDFLDDDSKLKYEEEKAKREKGDYSIYDLTFVKTQSKVSERRRAHGVPLPVPKEFQKRVPDRFGIFTVRN